MMTLYEKVYRYFTDPAEAADIFYSRSDTEFTYGQAGAVINSVSNILDYHGIQAGNIVAIEAEKEFETYCCIIACLIKGITYVPFSKAQKFSRVKESLSQIATDLIITTTDEAHAFFETGHIREIAVSAISRSSRPIQFASISDNQIAYIMFSSGTTGVPKAIPITRKNLMAYIDSIESQFRIDYKSGFSQIAELTFDLSVHDIYLCISNKGFLCPIKSEECLLGYRFVNELKINYWMSVPSTASYMFQMISKVECMSSLKCSFFLGEALSTVLAKKWIEHTPNGITVNTYGPTECTVAASFFVVDPADKYLDTRKLVPIGRALKNTMLHSAEKIGAELLLGGEQLFPGYIGEAKNSNVSKFVYVNADRMYRTGDLVDEDEGCFYFKGRIDFQIKVRGYRIELEELEAVLSKYLVGDFCVVPMNEIQTGNYDSLAILYQGPCDDRGVQNIIDDHFPSYIPIKKILWVETVPRNINGKLDRSEALRILGLK